MSRASLLARIRKLEAAGGGLCKCGPVVIGESCDGSERPYKRAEDVPPCLVCGRPRLVFRIEYDREAEPDPDAELVEPPEQAKPTRKM